MGKDISPTSVVLLQELERFNKLVVRMQHSLAELQRVRLTEVISMVQYTHNHVLPFKLTQALVGEVGMSSELDEFARALFNGQIPAIWKNLAPDTLKSLGNWMSHFKRRYDQYSHWVRQKTQLYNL